MKFVKYALSAVEMILFLRILGIAVAVCDIFSIGHKTYCLSVYNFSPSQ